MIWIALSFLFFTIMVAVISAWKTRDDKLDTAEGYFLAGRGLPGIVIAGSLPFCSCRCPRQTHWS